MAEAALVVLAGAGSRYNVPPDAQPSFRRRSCGVRVRYHVRGCHDHFRQLGRWGTVLYIVEGIVGGIVGDLFARRLAILSVLELASRYISEDRLLYAAGGGGRQALSICEGHVTQPRAEDAHIFNTFLI